MLAYHFDGKFVCEREVLSYVPSKNNSSQIARFSTLFANGRSEKTSREQPSVIYSIRADDYVVSTEHEAGCQSAAEEKFLDRQKEQLDL